MVFYERGQSTRNLRQNGREDDLRIRRKRMRGQLKSKGHGKLSIHYCADQGTIETIFRTIVSAKQLSLYGAVANMCEEYESFHDRSGQLDKVLGQSIVPSEIKTEVPLENDDPAYQNFVLQQYEERIERLTQQDKLSGQGGWGPSGMITTGGGGLAESARNCGAFKFET